MTINDEISILEHTYPELSKHLKELKEFLSKKHAINEQSEEEIKSMLHILLSHLNKDQVNEAIEAFDTFVTKCKNSKKNNELLVTLQVLSLILAPIFLAATIALLVVGVTIFPPALFIALPFGVLTTICALTFAFGNYDGRKPSAEEEKDEVVKDLEKIGNSILGFFNNSISSDTDLTQEPEVQSKNNAA